MNSPWPNPHFQFASTEGKIEEDELQAQKDKLWRKNA